MKILAEDLYLSYITIPKNFKEISSVRNKLLTANGKKVNMRKSEFSSNKKQHLNYQLTS